VDREFRVQFRDTGSKTRKLVDTVGAEISTSSRGSFVEQHMSFSHVLHMHRTQPVILLRLLRPHHQPLQHAGAGVQLRLQQRPQTRRRQNRHHLNTLELPRRPLCLRLRHRVPLPSPPAELYVRPRLLVHHPSRRPPRVRHHRGDRGREHHAPHAHAPRGFQHVQRALHGGL